MVYDVDNSCALQHLQNETWLGPPGKRYNNQSARNDLVLVEEIRGKYCKLRVKLLFDIAVRKTWKYQRSKEGDV